MSVDPDSYDTGHMSGWCDRKHKDLSIILDVFSEQDSKVVLAVLDKIVKRIKEED